MVRGLARVLFVVLVVTTLCLAYGFLVEPTWLKVRHVRLNKNPTVRIVFFTDLHHKGDEKYLKKVIAAINRQSADVVLFGGDLCERKEFFDPAIEGLKQIRKPVFGVPGNHDYWSGYPFVKLAQGFRATGGDLLCDTNVVILNGAVEIVGRTGREIPVPAAGAGTIKKRILLIHYPDWNDRMRDAPYDVTLAGHTHGGQVRLPWVGPVLTLLDGEDYQSGLFKPAAGPLYVSAGVGAFFLPVRFFCRPEIVVVEL